jgi:O-antigen ligase
MVLLWLCVLATGTRAAWLGMAVAGLLFFVVGGVARRWAIWQLLSVVLALLAYWGLFVLLPAAYGVEVVNVLSQRVLDSTDASRVLSGRDALYQLSFRLIAEHPWLGVGPMHFTNYPEAIAGNPHNAVLHIAVEWGLPTLVLVLLLVALYARRMWIHHRTALQSSADPASMSGYAMWVCLMGAVLATAVQSMFSSILADPNSLLWLAVVVGWSLGLTGQPLSPVHSKEHSFVGQVSRWVLFAGAMACIATLMHVVARDLPLLAVREQVYLQKYGLPLKPRFWRQGMIHQ